MYVNEYVELVSASVRFVENLLIYVSEYVEFVSESVRFVEKHVELCK